MAMRGRGVRDDDNMSRTSNHGMAITMNASYHEEEKDGGTGRMILLS
jgi:hypothetical protein